VKSSQLGTDTRPELRISVTRPEATGKVSGAEPEAQPRVRELERALRIKGGSDTDAE
jgi:hypothetical protein